MADEEELPDPPTTYSLTPEGGEPKSTSTEFTGVGKALYTNGDEYEGAFENGTRHGKGVYKYYNRYGFDEFHGTFENNMRTGLGRHTYKKGGFYHGNFKNNLRHGEGTFKYANGDIYSGMWKDGKKDGKGTYVFNTTKYEMRGTWSAGQVTQGTWTLSDGTKYVGGFKHQKPCGDGVWQTSKGTSVEGAYVQQVVPLDNEKIKKAGAPLKTEARIFWKTATMVSMEDTV